ncbi:MAG: PAS domain-containing protein [Nodosilinea sp.]
MDMFRQIEAVCQRRAELRQQAAAMSPTQPDVLDKALQELDLVLEELQASNEELQHQSQALALAQQHIKLEQQRYQALFELAPDACVVTDCRGKINQANRAAIRLFALPVDDLVNKPLIDFIEADYHHHFQAHLAQPGHIQNWQIVITRRNQASLSVTVATAGIKDAMEQNVAILWCLRDVNLSPPQRD